MANITKSPWIIHYDGSSCNGCDIETLACLTPMYDAERFGIINTGNPKHADVFLVTGSVNEQNLPVIRQIYDQMPNPKVVIAIGVCASSGGIFKTCYNIIGGIDQVIPVDVYVPGCAARPEAIIDGIVKGLGVLAEKHEALTKGKSDFDVAGAYLYEGPHDEEGTLVEGEGPEVEYTPEFESVTNLIVEEPEEAAEIAKEIDAERAEEAGGAEKAETGNADEKTEKEADKE